MNNLPWLLVVTLIFYTTGGIVDYWQSAMEHNKKLPAVIKNYFAIPWLILYSGLLPFGFVFVASDFNLKTSLYFISFAFLGMVLWDLIYSKLDQKMLISEQKDYFYWGRRYFALSKKRVVYWHVTRIVVACVILGILAKSF